MRRGFTLFELLITFAFASIVLPSIVLFGARSEGFTRLRADHTRLNMATRTAQDLLADDISRARMAEKVSMPEGTDALRLTIVPNAGHRAQTIVWFRSEEGLIRRTTVDDGPPREHVVTSELGTFEFQTHGNVLTVRLDAASDRHGHVLRVASTASYALPPHLSETSGGLNR